MLFQDLPGRIAQVNENIERARARGRGQTVTVIAVTKTYGPEAPRAAYEAGLRDVGENRLQEALGKRSEVTEPLKWHLIGHLQRNKVKQTDGFALIHSMDSARLADALDAHGRERGTPVHALLQVNVSGEGTKGGYVPGDIEREAE